MNDRVVKDPKLLRRILEAIRRVAKGLVALIGCETEKDYVLRPWTEEENADFERFCASIGVMPSDPEWAEAMECGEWGEFFSNDPWYDMDLPRA